MHIKQIQHKTARILQVEQELGEPIEEYLRRRFIDENASLHELADEVGLAYRILLRTLEQAGVYGRRLGIEDKC